MKYKRKQMKWIKVPLYLKLVCSFLAVSLGSLLVFGIFSNRLYLNEINNRTISFNTAVMKTAADDLNEFIANIDRLSETILTKHTQQSIKHLFSTDSAVKINAIIELNHSLESQTKSLGLYSSINMISVIGVDGYSIYENTGSVQNSFDFLELDWFKEFSDETTSSVLINPHPTPYLKRYTANSSQAQDTLSYMRRISSIETPSKVLGYLMIDFSMEDIVSILNPLILSESSSIIIADKSGKSIYASNPKRTLQYQINELEQMQSKNYEIIRDNNIELVQFTHKLPRTGWYVICENQSSLLASDNRAVVNMIFILLLSIFLFTITISFWLTHGIVAPVSKLKKTMISVQNGDMNAFAVLDSNDEIGELGEIFNEMLHKINSLVDEVYTTKIKEQESRIFALESQINPHFLFNTLENIRSIANVEEVDVIENMTTALSNMFRYSMKFDNFLVPIQQELEHVKDYLYIIQIRYDHAIKVTIDVLPSIFECRVLKLILQPIVENAIIHGLSKIENRKELFIGAKVNNGALVLSVKDNGAGIEPKRLAEIQDNLYHSGRPISDSHRNSIGISNVNDRIKLRFGEEYRLTIDSELHQGTTVTIKLPLDFVQT